MNSSLDDPNCVIALIAVLTQRLGGDVKITQADFDLVAHVKVRERGDETGLRFTIESPNEMH